MIYRIKPMVWVEIQDPKAEWHPLGFSVYEHFGKFKAMRNGELIGVFPTRDLAKRACEKRRLDIMERELEPAYHPTADLPTEPGLYWWRNSLSGWRGVELVRKGSCLMVASQYLTLRAWVKAYGQGQWIRIPEPEGAK